MQQHMTVIWALQFEESSFWHFLSRGKNFFNSYFD